MTFAAGWALAGLVLLAPLVLLHLRRRGLVVREVPSLLLWEQIELVDAKGSRGLRRPPLPLLLALQALALALLVFAFILTSLYPADPNVGFGASYAYFLIYGVPAGVLLGALIGLALDRRSRRRARTVTVEHQRVD